MTYICYSMLEIFHCYVVIQIFYGLIKDKQYYFVHAAKYATLFIPDIF